ncbi:ubiquitin-like protein [Pseudomonas syringae]|uniref:ubiquitin-like protein n=1 Tax=Pseudomonas syringae TaxID=317 RepID=UPI000F007DAE|nr:ubiquitin-like protein [Pseudomonas azotoformans]
MNIFIVMITNKTIEIECNPSDTIENIKALIQDREGIPPGQQRLYLSTRLLEDGHRLSDYSVGSNATLQCKLELRGGG